MLKMFTLLGASALFTSSALAGGDVATVTCKLTPGQSGEVAELRLRSVRNFAPVTEAVPDDGLEVLYRDGSSEFLEPVARNDDFGNPRFVVPVPFKTGRAFFPNSRVGDVSVEFTCYLAPGIPWERCQSQGTGEHGAYSSVNVRLGAQIVRFNGQNLCARAVSGE